MLCMSDCPACYGHQEIDLPFNGDIEVFDCPCCKPWRQGFSGYGYFGKEGFVWLIHPAQPNTAALHYTQEKEKRENNVILQPE